MPCVIERPAAPAPAPAGRTRVSVVVLSYNRPARLREALASVLAQGCGPAECVVVDNRSPASGAVAALAAEAGVRLLALPDNRGFTGGMNAGVRAASGRYVCLTEDDIVLAPGCLETLAGYLDAHPGVGVAGAVMYNRGSGTVRCAGGEQRLGPRYEKRVHTEPPPAPAAVSYLPGAFLLVRREVFERAGGFREDFFMYHDDNEFCLRVLRAGWGIAVVPAARVDHFEPDSAPAPAWLERMKLRNFFRLYLLHAPAAALPGFFLRYLALDGLRAALAGRRRCLWLAAAGLDVLRELPALLRDRRRMPRPLTPGVCR